jgi:LemA protein
LLIQVEARAKATQTQVNVDDAASFAKFQASQDALSSALSRLMVVVESYPDLKADQSFLELQAQLEGTENRISVERKNYNETVKDCNISIRKFPRSFIANMFDFDKANLFEAKEGADTAPVVDFSDDSN